MAMQLNSGAGVNTGLLAGFRSAMDMKTPERVTVDVTNFTKAYNAGEDRRIAEAERKRQKEKDEEDQRLARETFRETNKLSKETLALNKEKFIEDIESNKYINRLRQAEADTMKDKIDVDRSRVGLGRDQLNQEITQDTRLELAEVRQYQEAVLKMAEGTSDPKSRQKLAETYNKNPLVSKYKMEMSEDQFGKIAFKPPVVAERSISKQGSEFVGTGAKDSREANTAIAGVDQSLELIDRLEEGNVETGLFSGIKQKLGSGMKAIGMDNAFVDESQDLETLTKSLLATSQSMIKPLVGAAPTEKEGERVIASMGTTQDSKQVLKSTQKLIKTGLQQQIETKGMENDLVIRNPDNLVSAPKIVSQIQSFPKIIVGQDNKVMTFYEFSENEMRKNPESTYIERREKWARLYRNTYNTDRYIGTQNYKKEILDYLDSTEDNNIRQRAQ